MAETYRLRCRDCHTAVRVRRDGPALVLSCDTHGEIGAVPPVPPRVEVEAAPSAPAWALRPLTALELLELA